MNFHGWRSFSKVRRTAYRQGLQPAINSARKIQAKFVLPSTSPKRWLFSKQMPPSSRPLGQLLPTVVLRLGAVRLSVARIVIEHLSSIMKAACRKFDGLFAQTEALQSI
jgi:hypothetical protein